MLHVGLDFAIPPHPHASSDPDMSPERDDSPPVRIGAEIFARQANCAAASKQIAKQWTLQKSIGSRILSGGQDEDVHKRTLGRAVVLLISIVESEVGVSKTRHPGPRSQNELGSRRE